MFKKPENMMGLHLRTPVVQIDWRAFLIAIVVTPFAFAPTGVIFMGYGVVVTLVAAVVGLPAMILIGGPLAYLAITRFPAADGRVSLGAGALTGLIAIVLAGPLGVVAMVIWGESATEAAVVMLYYVAFGLIAAPLEGLIFAAIYRRFARTERIVDAEVFA